MPNEFDFISLPLEADALMDAVRQLSAEAARINRAFDRARAIQEVRNNQQIQRRKLDLREVAGDLRDSCQDAICTRRRALESNAIPVCDPEADIYMDMQNESDHIERLELALVRVKTALDMLRCIP